MVTFCALFRRICCVESCGDVRLFHTSTFELDIEVKERVGLFVAEAFVDGVQQTHESFKGIFLRVFGIKEVQFFNFID